MLLPLLSFSLLLGWASSQCPIPEPLDQSYIEEHRYDIKFFAFNKSIDENDYTRLTCGRNFMGLEIPMLLLSYPGLSPVALISRSYTANILRCNETSKLWMMDVTTLPAYFQVSCSIVHFDDLLVEGEEKPEQSEVPQFDPSKSPFSSDAAFCSFYVFLEESPIHIKLGTGGSFVCPEGQFLTKYSGFINEEDGLFYQATKIKCGKNQRLEMTDESGNQYYPNVLNVGCSADENAVIIPIAHPPNNCPVISRVTTKTPYLDAINITIVDFRSINEDQLSWMHCGGEENSYYMLMKFEGLSVPAITFVQHACDHFTNKFLTQYGYLPENVELTCFRSDILTYRGMQNMCFVFFVQEESMLPLNLLDGSYLRCLPGFRLSYTNDNASLPSSEIHCSKGNLSIITENGQSKALQRSNIVECVRIPTTTIAPTGNTNCSIPAVVEV